MSEETPPVAPRGLVEPGLVESGLVPPERIVAGFARALRAAGVGVPVGSVIAYTDALAAVGLDQPAPVYWAGRATLIHRPEDAPVYDQVFASYWADRVRPAPIVARLSATFDTAVDTPGLEPTTEGAGAEPGRALRYSAAEVLRHKDFAALTPAEWQETQRLISGLRLTSELRPSRRKRSSKQRRGSHPDLRATVRRSLPTGGLPLQRAWRSSSARPRRTVFILDVSGSMEPYARGLLRLAQAATSSGRVGQVEVFTVGTRLTRVTRQLRPRDPDAALLAAVEAVEDWSGGTRIGESIRRFNDLWGVRGMARGAQVVICSDGWDRGDPGVIAEEMARLRLVARRIIWVNPLKAGPGYAPLARGMAAALPYVDSFVDGHSVASLEHLAEMVCGAS